MPLGTLRKNCTLGLSGLLLFNWLFLWGTGIDLKKPGASVEDTELELGLTSCPFLNLSNWKLGLWVDVVSVGVVLDLDIFLLMAANSSFLRPLGLSTLGWGVTVVVVLL